MNNSRELTKLTNIEIEYIFHGQKIKEIEYYNQLLEYGPESFFNRKVNGIWARISFIFPRGIWQIFGLIFAIISIIPILGVEILSGAKIISLPITTVISLVLVVICFTASLSKKIYETFEFVETYPLSPPDYDGISHIICYSCHGSGLGWIEHIKGHYVTDYYNKNELNGEYGLKWVDDPEEKVHDCVKCHGRGFIEIQNKEFLSLNSYLAVFNIKVDYINQKLSRVNELIERKNIEIESWNESSLLIKSDQHFWQSGIKLPASLTIIGYVIFFLIVGSLFINGFYSLYHTSNHTTEVTASQTVNIKLTPTLTRPHITSVSPILATNHQTISIKGSGFGDIPPQTSSLSDGSVDTVGGGMTPWLSIKDFDYGSHSWTAGEQLNYDKNFIGIYINKWSDNEIVLGGFGNALGTNKGTWNIGVGDQLIIEVDTQGGQDFYKITVS